MQLHGRAAGRRQPGMPCRVGGGWGEAGEGRGTLGGGIACGEGIPSVHTIRLRDSICSMSSEPGTFFIMSRPETSPAMRLVDRSGRIESIVAIACILPPASQRVQSRMTLALSE